MLKTQSTIGLPGAEDASTGLVTSDFSGPAAAERVGLNSKLPMP